MAKRSVGRPKTDSDNVTTKVNRALVMKAKLIAADQGVSAADLLNELLQVPVDRAYALLLRKLDSSGKK